MIGPAPRSEQSEASAELSAVCVHTAFHVGMVMMVMVMIMVMMVIVMVMEMEIQTMKMMMNKRKTIKINRYFKCFILGKINNDLCFWSI